MPRHPVLPARAVVVVVMAALVVAAVPVLAEERARAPQGARLLEEVRARTEAAASLLVREAPAATERRVQVEESLWPLVAWAQARARVRPRGPLMVRMRE